MNTEGFNNGGVLLSGEEIGELCSLYLEGRLNVDEERALERILASSYYSGEAVEETLFLMGLAASESYRIKEYANARNKSGNVKFDLVRSLFNILKTSVAAVCLVFSMSLIWNYFNPSQVVGEPVYEVYADGNRISDPEECRLMALKSYEKSQRFIAEMKAIQNEKLVDFEKKKIDADNKYKEMQSYLNEMN